MHTLNVFSIFLLGTSLGGLILLPLVPFRDIGPRFYRFFGILAAVFVSLYALFNHFSSFWFWFIPLALLSLYIVAMTKSPQTLGIKLFYPLALLGAGFLFFKETILLHNPLINNRLEFILYESNCILSSLLLGSTLMAMILGHWYLVEPKLSIKPFMRLTWAFILILMSRFFLILAGLLFYWKFLPKGKQFLLEKLISVEGDLIFLLQRVLFGLFLPALLSYFVWNTVKIRSTQSATGILYVNLVFVLIGELIGFHLTLKTGFLM